ncbi:hypothetical protein [Kitasatospora sp. NPDC057223]|uniref:wHTH domain-containing protein n=1 Tax=Kitasatospora sp. NPDC057223 TaxID=3346055 RepID=UPI0036307A0D
MTVTANPTKPAEAAAAPQPIAAAERLVAPAGPLPEASWRSGRLDAGDLLARLTGLPDSVPVMTGDELLVDTVYDGTLHLHTARTAPPFLGPGEPVAPATVWRSARTRLLTVGELRERLAEVSDSAPVTVGGDPLMDADYGGTLQVYTPFTGDPEPYPDEDDEED